MKMNFAESDAIIHITGDRLRGLWAAQIFYKGTRTTRVGGQLNTHASTHTLLVVALVAGLRGINRAQAVQLLKAGPPGLIKPRVAVACSNASFVDALTAMLARQPTAGRQLRAGRNFLVVAAQQAARFRLSLASTPVDDKELSMLNKWMHEHLFDAKAIAKIPDALSATAVSQVC